MVFETDCATVDFVETLVDLSEGPDWLFCEKCLKTEVEIIFLSMYRDFLL